MPSMWQVSWTKVRVQAHLVPGEEGYETVWVCGCPCWVFRTLSLAASQRGALIQWKFLEIHFFLWFRKAGPRIVPLPWGGSSLGLLQQRQFS